VRVLLVEGSPGCGVLYLDRVDDDEPSAGRLLRQPIMELAYLLSFGCLKWELRSARNRDFHTLSSSSDFVGLAERRLLALDLLSSMLGAQGGIDDREDIVGDQGDAEGEQGRFRVGERIDLSFRRSLWYNSPQIPSGISDEFPAAWHPLRCMPGPQAIKVVVPKNLRADPLRASTMERGSHRDVVRARVVLLAEQGPTNLGDRGKGRVCRAKRLSMADAVRARSIPR
jgi:hypothetical protein